MANEPELEGLVPDLHHVQVIMDGQVFYEDRNVTEGAVMFHRGCCSNPECEGSKAANYSWSIECQTLTELDMDDGERQEQS